MGDIYAGCAVCISTAVAHKATQSTFTYRKVETIEPASFLDSVDSKVAYLLVGLEQYPRGFGAAPIARRGWTLQERLLSPRILTLGWPQIYWECEDTETMMVCETFPSGIKGIFPSCMPFSLPDVPTSSQSIDKTFKTGSRPSWRHLVETYSKRTLTFPEDKPAAFSGIAAHMQKVFQGSLYLAGLFEFDFPEALWWIPSQLSPRRPKHNQIPSWPWLATDVSLHFSELYCRPERYASRSSDSTSATLLSHHRETQDPTNQFSQVLHAELKLRAPLLALSWERIETSDRSRKPEEHPDIIVTIARIGFKKKTKCIKFDSLEDFEYGYKHVYLLPLFACVDNVKRHSSFTATLGLLIRQSSRHTSSRLDPVISKELLFERIGAVIFSDEALTPQIDLLETKDLILF